jgi:hypothetical protein
MLDDRNQANYHTDLVKRSLGGENRQAAPPGGLLL